MKGPHMNQHMRRHVTPNVKRIKTTLDNGENPETVPLFALYGPWKEGEAKGQMTCLPTHTSRFPSVVFSCYKSEFPD